MKIVPFWYLVIVKDEYIQQTQKSKVSRTAEKLKLMWDRTEWLRLVPGKMAEPMALKGIGPFSPYHPSKGLLSHYPSPSLEQLWCFSCFLVIWVRSLSKLKTKSARREVSSFSWFSELNSSLVIWWKPKLKVYCQEAERTSEQDHPCWQQGILRSPKPQLHPQTGSQEAVCDWLKQKLLGVGHKRWMKLNEDVERRWSFKWVILIVKQGE